MTDTITPEKLAALQELKRRGTLPPEKMAAVDELLRRHAGQMSWGDVMGMAGENLGPSAVQLAKDTATPFMHPLDTMKTLASLGLGIIDKFIPGQQVDEKTADAVGKFFMDRYGSLEGIKRTIATDPAGVMADLSTVLTGGGMLASKVPGTVGKVGRAMNAVGNATDPLVMAAKGARAGGKGVAAAIGNFGTGTGAESLTQAYKAGRTGGRPGRAFQDAMRGKTSIDHIIDTAKNALTQMRIERGDAYRKGMAEVGKIEKPLEFSPIDKAVSRVRDVGNYKGMDIRPSTSQVWQKINDAVNEWKSLDPAVYHTPEGIDALKQKIGNIRDATDFGTPDRVVADAVYHAVKNQIVDQAPEYAKVMKNYEAASDTLREIQKTLSLHPNASVDTQLRKLQSVMRNNVQTNYGRRLDLTNRLNEKAPTLMPEIAGQAMNDVMPRGLVGKMFTGGAGLAGLQNPAYFGLLPFGSPRVMGEAAYYTGKGAGLLGDIPRPGPAATRQMMLDAFQAGRVENQQNR